MLGPIQEREGSRIHPPPFPSAGAGFAPDPILENGKKFQKILKPFSHLILHTRQLEAHWIGRNELCINCEFRMIPVALITMMSYYA
jgi:hypothetical protein